MIVLTYPRHGFIRQKIRKPRRAGKLSGPAHRTDIADHDRDQWWNAPLGDKVVKNDGYGNAAHVNTAVKNNKKWVFLSIS